MAYFYNFYKKTIFYFCVDVKDDMNIPLYTSKHLGDMELSIHHQKRWDFLQEDFGHIIDTYMAYHTVALHAMMGDLSSIPNILIYGVYGLPLELMWKEGLKRRLGIEKLADAVKCTWNKDVHYMETPYYIHVDLENPYNTTNIDVLQEFLKTIITTKSILCERHTIVLENIDSILQNATSRNAFRVLLERFSRNVWFICTTYHASKLEQPLISRFCSIRCPLPTEEQVQSIVEYIDSRCGYCGSGIQIKENPLPLKTRNLVRALSTPSCTNNDLAWLSSIMFPPVGDYIVNTKEPSIDGIRAVIYKAYQCGISPSILASDIIDSCIKRGDSNTTVSMIVKELSSCEHMLAQSKGMRTLLYMEYMLHYVMVIVTQNKKKDPR